MYMYVVFTIPFPYHSIPSEFLGFSYAFITPQVTTVQMDVHVHVQTTTKKRERCKGKTQEVKLAGIKEKNENFSKSANIQKRFH